MTTEIVALKHATETTAVVFFRGLSNGVLTVSCNGQTFTGDTINTALLDGTGLVTVTGLTAGTSYPFTLYLAGVEKYNGSLKTAPAAGSTFTFGFGACAKYNRPWPGDALLEKFPDLAGFVFEGDFPYLDDIITSNFTMNGETIVDLGKAMIPDPASQVVAEANIYAHHRYHWQMQGAKQLLQSVPCYFIPSDHDVGPGDNWDGTIAKANAYHTWATLQSHVDNMDTWVQDALRKVYWRGNPSNASANKDAAYAASEQMYFAHDVGDATMIYLDHASNSDWSSTYLGATQTTWAQEVLAASTKTFKIIFCGGSLTEFISNTATQAPEWKTIKDYIVAQGITGVVVCVGDLHTPAIFRDEVTHVRGGASGQTPHLNLTDGYTNYCRYKYQGYYSNGTAIPDRMHVCGYVTVHGSDYLEFGIVTDTGDDLVTPGRIYAGSNDVTYPAIKFG